MNDRHKFLVLGQACVLALQVAETKYEALRMIVDAERSLGIVGEDSIRKLILPQVERKFGA